MKVITDLVGDNVEDNLMTWKKSYPWYYQWVQGNPTDQFYQYAYTNPEYKNMVANTYLLLYLNYLPAIETYRSQAVPVMQEWEKEVNQHR